MSGIQIIIVLSAASAALIYLRTARSLIADRVLAITSITAITLAVAFPDWTTKIAHFLGVNRGTDLLLYLMFASACVFGVMLYTKLVQLAQVQTELVRALAIAQAATPRSKLDG